MKKILIALITLVPIFAFVNVKANTEIEVIGEVTFEDQKYDFTFLEFSNQTESTVVNIYTTEGFKSINMITTETMGIKAPDSKVKFTIEKDGTEKVYEYTSPSIWLIHGVYDTEVRVTHETINGTEQDMFSLTYKVENQEKISIDYIEKAAIVKYSIDGVEETHLAKSRNANGLLYPDKEGFVFDGWYIDSELKTKLEIPFTIFTDMVLYPKWKEKIDPIELTIDNRKVIVNKGEEINLDYFIPFNDDYTFNGWFLDSDSKERLDDNVFLENTKIFSNFRPYVYFYTNVDDYREHAKVLVNSFGKVTFIPTPPVKNGFKFLGWKDINGNSIDLKEFQTEKNAQLYADFERTDSVIISLRNITGFIKKIELDFEYDASEVGNVINILDLLDDKFTIVTGYKFLGFFTNPQRTEKVDVENFEIPSSDITLYPIWEQGGKVTVSFETNMDGVEYDPIEFVVSTLKFSDLPTPIKYNYAFLGWYADEELTEEVNAYHLNSSEDFVLYGKWLENAAILYFEMNGGGKIAPIVNKFGDKINLPLHLPARKGYIFTGWFYDNELTQRIDKDDVFTMTTSTTIYAGWELDEDYEEPIEDVDNTEKYITYAIYGVIGLIGIGIVGAIFFPKKKKGRR